MASITDLPNKVLLKIFRFSQINSSKHESRDFDESGDDDESPPFRPFALRARLVCHRWNNLILGQFHRFFKGINLYIDRDFIDFLENSQMARIDSSVVKIEISYFSFSTLPSEISNIQLLSNLKELEFFCNSFDDDESSRRDILKVILNKSLNLTKLAIYSWIHFEFVLPAKLEFLTDLTVKGSWFRCNLLRKLPRLEFLELNGVTKKKNEFELYEGMLDNLKVLRLIEVDLRLCRMILEVIPKSLEQLDYIAEIAASWYEYNPLDTLVKREIKLKSLGWDMDKLILKSEDQLVNKFCRIKSLECLRGISIDDEGREHIRFCRFTNVKDIPRISMVDWTLFGKN